MRFAAVTLLIVPAVVLSALSAGCPGGSETQSGGGGECGAYFDALNALTIRCGGGELSHNREASVRECTLDSAAPGANYAAFFQSCTSVLSSVSCDDFESVIEPGQPCAPPAGTLPPGSPCESALQCQSRRCGSKGMTMGKPSFCGTCTRGAEAGQPCSLDADGPTCVPGTRCKTGTDAGVASLGGVCQATVRGPVGSMCSSSTECESALDCRSNKCTPRAALNGDCSSAGCASGLYCASVTKTCAALPKAGEPCVESDKCPTGLSCVAGACNPIVYANSGEPCDGKATRCKEGTCITSVGIGDAGQPVSTAGECPAVLAEGAACDENLPNQTCPEPTECYDGTCQIADANKCF